MDGFADKLTLVIKTLGISRAELGAALAVDKSVVSRWFAGARAPTAHNLAAITALVAARAPGFTMLDWDRDLAGLELRLRPGGAMAVGPDNTLSLALPPGAAAASAARGAAVTGVWRLNYSAGITEQPGLFLNINMLVQQSADGQLVCRANLFDAVFRGTALVSGNHLYALLAHPATGAPLLGICNMGKSERLVLMDGLILFCRDGYGGVPTAAICMVERIGDLTGDEAADDALYADLVARNPPVIDAALPETTRAILLRDIGPAAAAAGGDLGMIMPFFRTLARGA